MNEKVGHIYTCLTPYQEKGITKMKQRPVLIIGKADEGDFTSLPVSKVTFRWNIDPKFDIEVDPTIYPRTNLKNLSYIRTHKIFTASRATLYKDVCDLRNEYPELYNDVLSKFKDYTTQVLEKA